MSLPSSILIRTFLAAAFVSVVCSHSYAEDVTWNGILTDDWEVGLNWDTGNTPTSDDFAYIPSGTVNITDNSGTTPNIKGLRQKGGTLNISGGTVEAGQVGQLSIFDGSVAQSGGFVSVNVARIGVGADSSGSYTLTGGEFNVARGIGNVSLNLGGLSSGTGSLTIAGGSFAVRQAVRLGGSASTGSGSFTVSGSQSSIAIGGNGVDGVWNQSSGSSLVLKFDASGTTPIFIRDNGGSGTSATFANGSILDVEHLSAGDDFGGTWTVLEVQNGDVDDQGLEFAAGVDTSIWSFTVDNSGSNGKLIVSAIGDPAEPVGFDLMVGTQQQQKMRFGMDYERLWFWNSGFSESEKAKLAKWSAIDTRIDYIRVAMNSAYELEEGNYNLSAYTNKIIPMMQAMKDANPDLKFFASPRPLNEAYSGKKWKDPSDPDATSQNVKWQPYPIWVTGAPTPISGNFNFQPTKCGEYIERYLLLMKSYGLDISFMDLTNEWQANSGGRITQDDARIVTEYLKDSSALMNAGIEPPLFIGPSAWNYSQGANWISNLDGGDERDAVDIAACHNTDRTGTAQAFADAVHAKLGDDTEIWNTEVHGWKSTSSENETTSFYYMLEKIRAGFTGLNGWLAIGQTGQGHAYILNQNGTRTRNVKYFIFKKLSETSNYGHALDIVLEPSQLSHTAALIKGNLMTVWVINQGLSSVPLTISPLGRSISESSVKRTRWTDASDVEGFVTHESVNFSDRFYSAIPAESVCCFEILLEPEDEDLAYNVIQAEDSDEQAGLQEEQSNDDDGTPNVAFIENDDFARYDDVALAEDSAMRFRVARPSGRDDGWIDIYLLSPGASTASILTATPAAKVAVPETDGWQDYVTIEAALENTEGDYDVVLHFKEIGSNNRSSLFNFNWLSAVGPGNSLLGDFDQDGIVGLADLDQYIGNIGESATGALADLDLDGDGVVGENDFQQHYGTMVETSNGGKGTFAGDLNLDGTVNVLGDAFTLVGNLGNAVSSWASGDVSADGVVNVLGDAFKLVGNLGKTNGGAQ